MSCCHWQERCGSWQGVYYALVSLIGRGLGNESIGSCKSDDLGLMRLVALNMFTATLPTARPKVHNAMAVALSDRD